MMKFRYWWIRDTDEYKILRNRWYWWIKLLNLSIKQLLQVSKNIGGKKQLWPLLAQNQDKEWGYQQPKVTAVFCKYFQDTCKWVCTPPLIINLQQNIMIAIVSYDSKVLALWPLLYKYVNDNTFKWRWHFSTKSGGRSPEYQCIGLKSKHSVF